MKSSFFADLVTGISGFLFCLSLSIVLILHFRPLYVQEIKDQKLPLFLPCRKQRSWNSMTL